MKFITTKNSTMLHTTYSAKHRSRDRPPTTPPFSLASITCILNDTLFKRACVNISRQEIKQKPHRGRKNRQRSDRNNQQNRKREQTARVQRNSAQQQTAVCGEISAKNRRAHFSKVAWRRHGGGVSSRISNGYIPVQQLGWASV